MILLISPSEKTSECAGVIEQELQEPVRIVSTVDRACAELKHAEFSAVLLEQWLSDTSPAQADLVLDHIGGAALAIVNFGISTSDRVVRSVRAAIRRRQAELLAARESVTAALKAEFKDDITALLLACGLASQDLALTEAGVNRIKNIEEIAAGIRRKLLAVDVIPVKKAAHA